MGELAGVFNSPFVVPVAGCAMIGSIVVAGIWSGVRTREIKSHERLARIAQGLPVEPEWDGEAVRQATTQVAAPALKQYGSPNDGAGARRAGIVLSSIGFGLIVFFAFLAIVLRERDVFSGAAAGIIPLAIGIGFFVDANHRRRDYDRWLEVARSGAPGFGLPAYNAIGTDTAVNPAVPPPPPVGMTPAQASDWRPLH